MNLLAFLAISLVSRSNAIKFVDEISRSAVEVLHGSQTSVFVRQCTCDEMTDCYEQAKAQALQCLDPCWKNMDAVTSNPHALKKCIDERISFINELIDCFKHKIHACVSDPATASSKQVVQYNYQDMLRRVEDVINEQIHGFTKVVSNDSVKSVIEAGKEVAKCVKECFVEKNKGGYCFARQGCEPRIEDKFARSAIRLCSRQIKWKNEIGELCKCSSHAGVGGIADYCGMLSIMGKK